jgi:hypothetical protein
VATHVQEHGTSATNVLGRIDGTDALFLARLDPASSALAAYSLRASCPSVAGPLRAVGFGARSFDGDFNIILRQGNELLVAAVSSNGHLRGYYRVVIEGDVGELAVVSGDGPLLAGTIKEPTATTEDALVLRLDPLRQQAFALGAAGVSDGLVAGTSLQSNRPGSLLVGWSSAHADDRHDVDAWMVDLDERDQVRRQLRIGAPGLDERFTSVGESYQRLGVAGTRAALGSAGGEPWMTTIDVETTLSFSDDEGTLIEATTATTRPVTVRQMPSACLDIQPLGTRARWSTIATTSRQVDVEARPLAP